MRPQQIKVAAPSLVTATFVSASFFLYLQMERHCYRRIFDIHTFEMTDGDLPVKAQSLVKEWLATNYEKLIEMWNTQVISKLEPLK